MHTILRAAVYLYIASLAGIVALFALGMLVPEPDPVEDDAVQPYIDPGHSGGY